MAQKIVSFEVAKALKEAGYPQTTRPIHCYNGKGQLLGRGGNYIRGVKYDATTYLDAWLWLWREKGIMVDTSQIGGKVDAEVYTSDEEVLYVGNELHDDPEEAIAKAIDYLVDNDLIK